jgi:hypothetical protein
MARQSRNPIFGIISRKARKASQGKIKNIYPNLGMLGGLGARNS